MYLQKVTSKKPLEKNLFLLASFQPLTKKQDPDPDPWYGSVPKCHGSTTLVLRRHSILLHQELPRKPDLAKESGTVITSYMIVTSEGQQGTWNTLKFGTYGIFYYIRKSQVICGEAARTHIGSVYHHDTHTHDTNQCWGSVTFWYGSGCGSSDPYLWLTDPMRIRKAQKHTDSMDPDPHYRTDPNIYSQVCGSI